MSNSVNSKIVEIFQKSVGKLKAHQKQGAESLGHRIKLQAAAKLAFAAFVDNKSQTDFKHGLMRLP